MPSTGFTCARRVFFPAVTVLALLTAPACAQKLLRTRAAAAAASVHRL
jgi:hypothetical protein